ncbi:hypothetical protein CUS_6671 [Ruminococcus albus 8]|uniref:Uncharacterized protein n=1 Tax=Ruminococcus albus 8 TaxID=246199 RepID=E9SCR7_RUMAL|nr:hypothetical protein CUS_6671 [Ruminococcus albus 8]
MFMAEGHVMGQNDPKKFFENPIAIRLKIQTKSSQKPINPSFCDWIM